MARNRRVDQALQTPNRGIWIATAVVLLLGLVAVLWVSSPTERRRRQAMDRVEVGDSTGRVVELLGEPQARCSGRDLTHLQPAFPPGWPAASVEAALQVLGERTRERWVYPLSLRRAAGCAARDGQTEVGVGPDGRIVWYVTVTGKTPLVLPDEVSPARPGGAASDH